jgi:uncharacterized protein (DUF1697 family)
VKGSKQSQTPNAAQVALLRAVNVGGHGKVAMADLRTALERRGFAGLRTVMQTGNLILPTAPAQGAKLEALLERELEAGLELVTDVFVRSAAELDEVIAKNPFPAQAKRDPSHLLVVFRKTPADEALVRAIRATITGREAVEVVGRHLYIVYPDGIGRSKLKVPEKKADANTRGTGRNWNTVLKLAESLHEAPTPGSER